MSRKHRANNSGMHLMHGPQRPYGKCPICQQVRPMHWISRVDFLCHACLKKSGHKPFVPPLEPQGDIHTERPARMRPLRQPPRHRQPPPPKKRVPRQAHKQSQKRLEASYIPPSPEAQALWDQRRAAVEQRAEQLQQKQLQQEREQKRRELELQLAQQADRPLIERIREYRRHRFLEDDASSS